MKAFRNISSSALLYSIRKTEVGETRDESDVELSETRDAHMRPKVIMIYTHTHTHTAGGDPNEVHERKSQNGRWRCRNGLTGKQRRDGDGVEQRLGAVLGMMLLGLVLCEVTQPVRMRNILNQKLQMEK